MCGIFGFVNPRRQQENYAYELLRHRGPDASGHWADGKLVFEHTRLSILDLRGSEPTFRGDSGKGSYLQWRDLQLCGVAFSAGLGILLPHPL